MVPCCNHWQPGHPFFCLATTSLDPTWWIWTVTKRAAFLCNMPLITPYRWRGTDKTPGHHCSKYNLTHNYSFQTFTISNTNERTCFEESVMIWVFKANIIMCDIMQDSALKGQDMSNIIWSKSVRALNKFPLDHTGLQNSLSQRQKSIY